MERRKLLIGSGAAFVTALAGCTGSDSDDDDGADDSDEMGDEYSDDEHDDGDDHDDDDYDDVPGFDSKELDIDSDKMGIDRIKHDGKTVSVEATATDIDPDKLSTELHALATDVSKPTHDIDRFKSEIDQVEWTVSVTDSGKTISFYIKTIWVYEYMNGKRTEDKFLDAVLDTVE